MPRLGEGISQEDARVEAALLKALAFNRQIDGRELVYARVTNPIASPMHCGVDGDGWRIDTASGAFFLKLYDRDTADFIDLDASFGAAAAAAMTRVGPELLWSEPVLGAAMWEYKGSDWRTAIFDDSWSTDIVSGVATALHRLHGGKRFGITRNVFETLEKYVLLGCARGVKLPGDFGWMHGNVRDIAAAISAAGVDYCPCHGDLIASNIMIGPRREVIFVDWDEAGDADPYWDIGVYMAEAFPFDEAALAMIEEYSGRADRRLLSRARLYGIAADLAWAVRSLILAHQTQRTDVEYFKYGQWRALRCRVALHDPKFEQMLRYL